MNIEEFQEALFAQGRAAGLDDMEIYVSQSKEFNVKVFQEEVDHYSLADVLGVGFRAQWQQKMGYAYTEVLDQQSIGLLVDQAKINAQLIDSEDEVEIFAGSDSYPEVQAFNQSFSQVGVEEKIAFARELEEAALAKDSRVISVNYAVFADSEDEIYMANTKGLCRSFARNSAACLVMAVVKEGERVKTGTEYRLGNRWEEFDAKKLAEDAVDEAVSMLQAETLDSRDYSVILRHDAAADVLKTFAPVFSAENVQKGLSRLDGRLGDSIASGPVTLMDDPLLENGAATAPFDGEGVASFTKAVIAAGVLKTFLHNLKTANKDGVESTGNAHKASFKSPVGIAPTNFFIQPGSASLRQLMETMDDGVLITDVQGLHSGANTVSGDFSLAAAGYRVKDGKIANAVDQITIAGNFFDVLAAVRDVGTDLKFGMGGPGGSVGSPSLWIDTLAIAGK